MIHGQAVKAIFDLKSVLTVLFFTVYLIYECMSILLANYFNYAI